MTSCSTCKHLKRFSDPFPGYDGLPRDGVCLASLAQNDRARLVNDDFGSFCRSFAPAPPPTDRELRQALVSEDHASP